MVTNEHGTLYSQEANSALERERKGRPITLIYVRHGEQTRYSSSQADLSERGVQQVNQFVDQEIKLLQRKGGPQIIKVESSSRRRTNQTANIINGALTDAIGTGRLNARLLLQHTRASLMTADPIGGLLEQHLSNEQNAIWDWQTFNPLLLSERGIRTPEEIATEQLQFIARYYKISRRFPNGPDITLFLSTHETTLAALAGKVLDLPPQRIDHAEPLKVVMGDFFGVQAVFRRQTRLFYPAGSSKLDY